MVMEATRIGGRSKGRHKGRSKGGKHAFVVHCIVRKRCISG